MKKWKFVVRLIGVLGLLFFIPIYVSALFFVDQFVVSIPTVVWFTLVVGGIGTYVIWLTVLVRKSRPKLSPADRLLIKQAKRNRPANRNYLRAGISIFVVLIALGAVPSASYWAYVFHHAPLIHGAELASMDPRAGRRFVTVDIGPSKSTGVMHWRWISHHSSHYIDGNYVLTTVDGHPLIALVDKDDYFGLPPFEIEPRRVQGTFQLISLAPRAAVSTGGDSYAYGTLQSKLDAAFKGFSPKPYPDFYLDTTGETREFGAVYLQFGVPALLLGSWLTFVYLRQRIRLRK